MSDVTVGKPVACVSDAMAEFSCGKIVLGFPAGTAQSSSVASALEQLLKMATKYKLRFAEDVNQHAQICDSFWAFIANPGRLHQKVTVLVPAMDARSTARLRSEFLTTVLKVADEVSFVN